MNIWKHPTFNFILSLAPAHRKTETSLLYLIRLSTAGHTLVPVSTFVTSEKFWPLWKRWIYSPSMVSKISSLNILTASLWYTEHGTVLGYAIVFFSNPNENTAFRASSPTFSCNACMVWYSGLNCVKTEKLDSMTFIKFMYVRSLVHRPRCGEHSKLLVKKSVLWFLTFFLK